MSLSHCLWTYCNCWRSCLQPCEYFKAAMSLLVASITICCTNFWIVTGTFSIKTVRKNRHPWLSSSACYRRLTAAGSHCQLCRGATAFPTYVQQNISLLEPSYTLKEFSLCFDCFHLHDLWSDEGFGVAQCGSNSYHNTCSHLSCKCFIIIYFLT